jgi:hypothetical protein
MQKRAKTTSAHRRTRTSTSAKRTRTRTRAIRPSSRRRRSSVTPAARRARSTAPRSKRLHRRGGTTARVRRTTARRSAKRPGRLSAKATTDRRTIIRWTEERGGHPATVIRTAARGEPGILRIDFPGFTGQGTLRPISWDEWFRKFEERNLAFLYQDRATSGQTSRFFKLIQRPSKSRRS